MPTHSALTGTDLHEPKGVTSATDGAIATAASAVISWVLPSYGEMSITGNSTAFNPVAADIAQYKKLASTGWAAGLSSGDNVTINSDDITVNDAGDYLINFWCSFETSASTGTTFGIKYALDSSTSTRKLMIQKNSSGADVLLLSASGIITVAVGEVLSVHLSSSASTALTITDGGLTLTRVK